MTTGVSMSPPLEWSLLACFFETDLTTGLLEFRPIVSESLRDDAPRDTTENCNVDVPDDRYRDYHT